MSCCCDLPNGLAARFSLSSFCSSGSTGSRSLQVFSLGIVDVTLLYSHFFMLKSDCKKTLLLTKYVEWKYSLHFKSDGRYYIWTEQLVLNISKNCPLKYFLAFLRFGVYYLIIMCVCFDFFISTGCLVSLLLLRQTAQALGWSSKIQVSVGITTLIPSCCWWCTTPSRLSFDSGCRSPL